MGMMNIRVRGNFIQVISTRRGVSRKATFCRIKPPFRCTLEHWYAEQGCDFCGWQLYERGELVDVLWGELEWSSPTDDDELPEVTGPAWIVDNVTHYGG
ncbi:putative aerotaxis sensor receptor, flavoprotein [Escherichia coli 2875000]|nr:putative aerotaxis sensor receptor, flavoprotein [Escherichia coli 2875000]